MSADPRLDAAELVMMVGCSGPCFTVRDCVCDSRGNHVETALFSDPCFGVAVPST